MDTCSFEAQTHPNPLDLVLGWGEAPGLREGLPASCKGHVILFMCSDVLIVRLYGLYLNYLSIFALIILTKKKKKNLRQRNCRLETFIFRAK